MHTSLGRKVLRQMCGFLQVSKFSPDWSQFGPVLLSLFPLIWSGFYLNGFGDKLPGEIYNLFGHKIQSECKLAFKIYWSKLLDDIKFVKMENYKSKFTFYQGNVQLTRLQRHTASKPKKIWWNCNKQTTTDKKKRNIKEHWKELDSSPWLGFKVTICDCPKKKKNLSEYFLTHCATSNLWLGQHFWLWWAGVFPLEGHQAGMFLSTEGQFSRSDVITARSQLTDLRQIITFLSLTACHSHICVNFHSLPRTWCREARAGLESASRQAWVAEMNHLKDLQVKLAVS